MNGLVVAAVALNGGPLNLLEPDEITYLAEHVRARLLGPSDAAAESS